MTDHERIDLGHGYTAERHLLRDGETTYRIYDPADSFAGRADTLSAARAFATRRANREAKRPTFCVSLYAVSNHGAPPILVGTLTVKADSAEGAKCAAYDALWADFHRTECEHDLYLVTKES